MKNIKKMMFFVLMLSYLILPMQSLKSEFFDKKFFEDIVKNVTIGSLTGAISAMTFYCIQNYFDNEIEQFQDEVKKDTLDSQDASKKTKEAASSIIIYAPGSIKTKFSDVAGLFGAKADMQDIISYLKNPHLYNELGAKIPKGILMSGRPGNGKTHLARAVAGEVNCPFISVSGAAFSEIYVGVGAARIRELFKVAHTLAEKYGACIIFIDEIDSIAQKRSATASSSDRDYNQTIGQLLQSMDGLEQDKNPIVVIAATNRFDVLDPAVIRPGRFDRKVMVNEPEIKDRIELLRVALKNVKHSQKLDIGRIARITAGFSGAKLAQLINEAAILAAKEGKHAIDMFDVELAYDHITLGREIQGCERNDADKWITAIHEAGHAAGWLFGNNTKYAIHKASIVPRSNALGVIWTIEIHESHKLNEEDMKAQIVMALCGGIAEQEFGFGKSTGPSSDLASARTIAYNMVVKYGMSPQLNYLSYDEIDATLPNDIATEVHKEVQKIIDECFLMAKKLVVSHKQDIEKIAQLLMKKGTVLGEEIYRLVGIPSPKLDSIFV